MCGVRVFVSNFFSFLFFDQSTNERITSSILGISYSVSLLHSKSEQHMHERPATTKQAWQQQREHTP
jgi:hypothetical protein